MIASVNEPLSPVNSKQRSQPGNSNTTAGQDFSREVVYISLHRRKTDLILMFLESNWFSGLVRNFQAASDSINFCERPTSAVVVARAGVPSVIFRWALLYRQLFQFIENFNPPTMYSQSL